MEIENPTSYKSHVLVLPFLGYGHINPMTYFCRSLASENIKVTVAATATSIKTLSLQPPNISLETIYDESTQGGFDGPGGLQGLSQRLESSGSNMIELLRKNQEKQNPIKCLVYDTGFPWALNLARQEGIMAVAFATQSCATIASYLKIMDAIANDEPDPLGLVPEFGFDKMPFMGEEPGRIPGMLASILSTLEGIEEAEWILFNSFDKLEEEIVKDLGKKYSIRTVGPTLSSLYLDDKKQSLSERIGDTCMDWLNTKKTGSVIYIAFGSVVTFSAEKMEEFAWGLKQSNTDFLWVVRASESHELPIKFKEEISGKGLIVCWAAQLDVLSHKAVGCFITHCGWNSTVEGISFGVPMIAVPQFCDQFGNAKFVEDVWKVGIRPKIDKKGFIMRDEIQRCVKVVMEGETIKRNAVKWKELATEAVATGGASD